jgi:hypothetical protein
VYSFIAQLVNSTAVLLLVSAGHSNIAGLDSGEARGLPRWLRTFIMNGSYTDFTPGWYEDVGVSLMVSKLQAARSVCPLRVRLWQLILGMAERAEVELPGVGTPAMCWRACVVLPAPCERFPAVAVQAQAPGHVGCCFPRFNTYLSMLAISCQYAAHTRCCCAGAQPKEALASVELPGM